MIIFSLQIPSFCFIIILVFAMEKWIQGLEILNILHNNSFEAYFVGGAVRDYLLQVPVSDIDITTNARPEEIAKLFSDVTMEGKKYYSCRIHSNGYTYEVTTFRKDISYQDHRHPITELANSLEEDLTRRDFTINAIAMDKNQRIIDLYQGRRDIENKIIRTIGNPAVRFEEDGLRVLRALDFASRWNFHFDEEILKSFQKDYICMLKEEYIIDMIQKIANNPFDNGLQYIVEYKLLRSFPFYQVVVEEAYRCHYTKYIYALFYVLHHFIPSNLKITKKEIQRAKRIAFWIHNQFNSIAAYYGDFTYLSDAIELYNSLYQKNMDEETVFNLYKGLPIQSPKDIQINWKNYSNSSRAKITKKLEKAILSHKVKNEEDELKKYLEIEE